MDNLRAAYNAVVDYHNSLVQVRFTIAALFFAANGFLAIGFFQQPGSALIRIFLAFLGMVMAAICWLLEVRTYQLLENLGKRGEYLEKSLGLRKDQGFFSLMKLQPVEPKWLPTTREMPEKWFGRDLVSHRVAFSSFYIIVLVLWLVMLILSICLKSPI